MWAPSIVGYGTCDYKYESGREGIFFLFGFSPREQNIMVYIMPGFSSYGVLMKKLGKYKTGKSCLYIKRLSDVDESSLNSLVQISVRDMRDKYTTY
jgi:hypothetical protein